MGWLLVLIGALIVGLLPSGYDRVNRYGFVDEDDA